MRQPISSYIAWALILISMFGVVMHISPVSESQAREVVPVVAPSIQAKQWLNSAPLTNQSLKGQVYLVEFWTFGCYNCVNVEPYVKQWYQRYHDQGFTVVAVHSPEFDHERDVDNVQRYIDNKSITYPVAIDNEFTIWRRFNNRYWPAMYLVDKQGRIRYTHFGEGRYRETENMIQKLLKE